MSCNPHKFFPISGVAWKPVLESDTLSKKADLTQSSQQPLGLDFLYFSNLKKVEFNKELHILYVIKKEVNFFKVKDV